MLKKAIVVGASSGIGEALARRMARAGYRVALVARRGDRLQELANALNVDGDPRCVTFVHDVRDVADARRCFDEAVTALGGLDVLVYAAGIMPSVELDSFDIRVDADILAVNTVGAMAWLNLGAERFLAQRRGTLVGIGSVAGDRGRIGNPGYCASKAALHTFMESLRNRLSRHGVSVVTIKPGPVRTAMTEGRDKLPLLIDADVAAASILRASERGTSTAYVPFAWMPIMAVIRHIPSLIFRRTNV